MKLDKALPTTSRRALLAGAVTTTAAVALAAPALAAAEADPVFAAIERAKIANAQHIAAIDALGHAEGDSRGSEEGFGNTAAAKQAQAVEDRACNSAFDAMWELAETVPTTRAGLAAYIAYAVDSGHIDENGEMAAAFLYSANEALQSF